MEEENHLNPLAKNYAKSDEFATNTTFNPASKQGDGDGKSSKALVYILLGVVVLSIVFLIFGTVFLRIKAPTLRLSNVVVKDLLRNSSSLNMTVIADFRLHNMNFGRFDFHDGSVTLWYGNATIGAAAISGGRVGSRKRKGVDATVEVVSGSSENYMNISRDIELNLVRVIGLAELKGEVGVMNVVKRRRTAFMNCSMDLNLTSRNPRFIMSVTNTHTILF